MTSLLFFMATFLPMALPPIVNPEMSAVTTVDTTILRQPKLFCSSTTLWGYGVLRYEEGCRQRLEQRLPTGVQLRAACGGRQARAAASVLQVQSRQPITIGAHSGDLSTQIFFPGQQADAMEWYLSLIHI